MISQDTHTRTILKTISWRFAATLTTIVIVLIFTGQIKLAFSVGGVGVVAKLILYFFHERIWNRIHFGRKKITPFVLWFTGLPSSGKTTLADNVYQRLKDKGYIAERLSGSRIRHLIDHTGFSKEERSRHIKKVGFLASLLEKNNVIVVSSFISPYTDDRDFVRKECNNFIEVYMDTPLEVCKKRDNDNLYKRAEQGLIDKVTGVDAPYQQSKNPEISINAANLSVEQSVNKIFNYLVKNKFIE
jgi:adenylylsulfate kinase